MSSNSKQVLAITLGSIGLVIGIVAAITAYNAKQTSDDNGNVAARVDQQFAEAQAKQDARDKRQVSDAEKFVARLDSGEKSLIKKINRQSGQISKLQRAGPQSQQQGQHPFQPSGSRAMRSASWRANGEVRRKLVEPADRRSNQRIDETETEGQVISRAERRRPADANSFRMLRQHLPVPHSRGRVSQPGRSGRVWPTGSRSIPLVPATGRSARALIQGGRNRIVDAVRAERPARQVTVADRDAFDLVVAMDRQNRADLVRLFGDGAMVKLLRDFSRDDEPDVPDPYMGDDEGFVEALEIIDRACGCLLEEVRPAIGG